MLLRTLAELEGLAQGRRGKASSLLQQRKMKAAAYKEDARGRREGKEKEERRASGEESGTRRREETEEEALTKERETAGIEEVEAESTKRQALAVGATVNVVLEAEWTCSLCTLINGVLDPHCSLCGTLREAKEGGLLGEDEKTRRSKGRQPCGCEGGNDEHEHDLASQLEEVKEKNERLLCMLMKMKDGAKRSKEEKERFSSYDNLMLAASSAVVTDDELSEVEAELEAKLALVRRVRRDHARARAQELEREMREMRATTLCVICADSPR
jgi:hypothetical protein